MSNEVVDASRFAAARAKEIKTLSQEIAAGKRGHVRAMQLLPHHKQRREMSTTPNKLPRKLRDFGQREQEGVVRRETEKKHRKHRRRPKYLMEDHARRQAEHEWLETHIWHAKRFKMTKMLWGFHVAKHPRDRATRAAYKAMRRQCIMYDTSYERTLRVQGGSREAVLRVLMTCCDPAVSVFGNAMYAGGTRVGHAMVHHPRSFPQRPIAPVRFLWREREVILFVHPAAFVELADALSAVDAAVTVVRHTQVVQFDFLGPLAHSLAQRVLRTADDGDIWHALAGIGDAATLPAGCVIALTVADPRLCVVRPAATTETAAFAPPALALLQRLVAPGHADAPALWDAAPTQPEPQAQLDARRGVGKLPEPLSFAPVLLVQTPGRAGLGAGYRLIVPRGWAMAFWLTLVNHGAHSVGLREMEMLSRQELGVPVFPADYPDTHAGQLHGAHRAARRVAKWLAHPPPKRAPMFPGDGAPFVAAPPASVANVVPCVWRTRSALPASSLVPVTIEMERRGAVEAHASLYSRDVSADPDQLVTALWPALGADDAAPRCEDALRMWRGEPVARSAAEEARVGVALGGGVSLLRGLGFGVGLVEARVLGDERAAVRVWLRNVGSRNCHSAMVKRIE